MKNSEKDCVIYYTKTKKSSLNSALLDKQDAWENLELIKKLYIERYKVFNKMKRSKIPSTLKKLAKEVTEIEFKLQDALKFPQDSNYHKWFDVPGCTCPKMDNKSTIGTKFRIVSSICPIHKKSLLN